MPRIIARLEERLPGGLALPRGSADLTYAAAIDIDEGRRWETDLVPATVEVCRSIPHDARVAAWEGRLFAPGLAEQFARFEKAALAMGKGEYSFRLSVYLAARQVAKHAEWLARTVAAAKGIPWPRDGFAAHPLTGETFHVSLRNEVETPFAFATARLPFLGIDPQAFADFVGDGGGGASEYLACSVSHPEAWFTGLHDLDEAAMDFLADGDFAALASSVSRWNAAQNVSALAPVFSAIHVDLASGGHAQAVAWAFGYMERARALAEAVRANGGAALRRAAKDSS